MSKLDDLHTLIRILKEFEFPISPILEFAIKEKMVELSPDDESAPPIMPVVEILDNGKKQELSVKPETGKKKKPCVLRIIRTDGSIIECVKAANTFCQAIKEVGVEKVFSLKIPMDSMHLVTIGGNPQYPTAQHDVGNGYFVNVHSNTITKKRQLERIFNACNLCWTVEIVESK